MLSSAAAMHASGHARSAVRLATDNYAAAAQENGIPPPVVVTGGVRPLMENNTARPLR
jgi:hypothetical protein